MKSTTEINKQKVQGNFQNLRGVSSSFRMNMDKKRRFGSI